MTDAHARYLKKKAKRITKKTLIYILLSVVSIIWLVPFVYLIAQSLAKEFIPSSFFAQEITFDNYIKLFTNTTFPFWRWFLNTFIIALCNMLLQTLLTLMTAYTLSRLRFKGRKNLMQFMLILGMFPGFLGMIATYALLQLVGLNTSIFGLVIIYAAGSAMNYYISKGFFDTIPKSLDEAVLIDGGSKNTVFWRIILPLSKPIIVYTLLMSFTSPWGDYMLASYIAQGKNNLYNVAVGLQVMVGLSNIQEWFTTFCAGAVVTSIPIMILFFFLQKYYVEGVTGGAVKG
jgi:arabinogalactan oligomer/maltooligosaccharide transport system permease protein